MDFKMELGMETGLGPGDFVFGGDPATSGTEGTPTTTQFLAHVYCGQTAGWMKMPLGTEVDLGPGHIVLDGVPALHETGTAATLFSAHVYCDHGRPSQLLLSSCNSYIWGMMSVKITKSTIKNENSAQFLEKNSAKDS